MKIKLIDSTLRDGNHTINNKFDLNDIESICKSLDKSNIDYIEVGYGYGLNSFSQAGYPTDKEIIKTALSSVKNSNVTILLFPNRCDISHLEIIAELGIKYIRIATLASNFTPGVDFVKKAKQLNLRIGAFLMMANRINAHDLLTQAELAKEAGVDYICVTDSSGSMTIDKVYEKIKILHDNICLPIGFHAHDNLGLAVGNSLAAIKAGAIYIDTALNGFGAGAGNTTTETFVAVLNKMNLGTNANFFNVLDASVNLSNLVKKYDINLQLKEETIMSAYTGVYSTFTHYAKELSVNYKVSYRKLLLRAAKENLIAGEEYKLESIARELSESCSYKKPNN